MAKKILTYFLCALLVSCSSPEEKLSAERFRLADEFVKSMKAGNIEELKKNITAVFKFRSEKESPLGELYYITKNEVRDLIVPSALHLASNPSESKKVRDAAIFVLFKYMSNPDSDDRFLKRRTRGGPFYFNSGNFHLNFLIANSGFNFGLSQI